MVSGHAAAGRGDRGRRARRPSRWRGCAATTSAGTARGYPDGLAGEDIPAGARILALADAWDVMTSARPYADPRPADEALEEIRREAGDQFAPAVVDALVRLARPARWSRGPSLRRKT